jgi:aminoglycoside phosphotransferase (APT) family kinase protein
MGGPTENPARRDRGSEDRGRANEEAHLERDLERAWPGVRVSSLERIPESHSGFTYRLRAELDGRPFAGVLRLPPPGARPVGPADVGRQARIMEAVRAAGLPAPAILASAEQPVLDGRPFIVMESVVGDRIETAVTTTAPRELLAKAFAAIRAIHELPPAATGIEYEGAVDPAGEVQRWRAVRTRTAGGLPTRATELEDRLFAALPAARSPRLVHGDYHLGNLLFRNGEVVAVLDWEISELGQSPLDEAVLCLLAIRQPFGEPQPGAAAALPLDEMVALADCGPDFPWYLAATCHKYGVILDYNLSLHRRGRRVDPAYERQLKTIPGLIEAGIDLLR